MSDLFKEQDRGAKAEVLLRDEMLVDAFATMERVYLEAWRESPQRDNEGRENIFQMLRALDALKSHLEEVVTTGKFASMQINETE
jgi:hypothetical protein